MLSGAVPGHNLRHQDQEKNDLLLLQPDSSLCAHRLHGCSWLHPPTWLGREAFLRWENPPLSIKRPQSYLCKICVHQCLNPIETSNRRRENYYDKGKFNLAEKKPRRVIRKVEDLADISGEIGKEIRWGGGGEEVAVIGLLVITKVFRCNSPSFTYGISRQCFGHHADHVPANTIVR